ncbi:MAG: glycosyltransferase family 4 protein [Bacteroidales bacterium]|nr:glycosyltransferase family 4 protein [Bacteroidales bacterium]
MRILIDLSILRHPYCGLGQVAMNYGRWYGAHAAELLPDHEVTLLVPRPFVGRFGTQVRYLVARDCYRWLPVLMPHFDVWHSIHQLAAFRPQAARTVLTIHDVNFMYEKSPAKQRKYLRRLQHECDRASEVCFISRFAQEDTLRHVRLHDKPTCVIPNGVELLTEGEQRQPQRVDSSKPFFLSLGVVKAKKNLHTLLPLMERLPDYQLVIAGNDQGAYADQLRRQAEALPNVQIIGPVDDAERRWLYAHCAGLLFPSLCEGFGLPVVEAMQWGKPVFCSDQTSLPEVGGDHAYYFRDFDPDRMAAVVRDGLEHFTPERAEAEKEYAAGFSYERHLRRYLRVLGVE